MEKSRLMVLTYQARSFYNTEKSCLMVLAYQTPTSQNNLWRSRLVWSRARDWKSRNRQKRFKSSNLFFSANTGNPTV